MRYFLALFLICASSGLKAQDTLAIQGRVLYEDDPKRSLISKPGWLRGLHILGSPLNVDDRPLITTPLPRSTSEQMHCARITSISGNYEALIEFEVPGMPPNENGSVMSLVTFKTDFPDTVKNISADNSGVTVRRGKCAGDTVGTSQYFATFWNNTANPLASGDDGVVKLQLNMNIARADEIEATAELGEFENPASTRIALKTPTCTKIDRLEALAFNYSCTVDVPVEVLQGESTASIAFTYSAFYRGRVSRPQGAEIVIGAVR